MSACPLPPLEGGDEPVWKFHSQPTWEGPGVSYSEHAEGGAQDGASPPSLQGPALGGTWTCAHLHRQQAGGRPLARTAGWHWIS